MDIIFMGTPDFAVPVLETLTASEKHHVKAVITQPDKARGRSGKLIFTPVKEAALAHDIPVYTPEKVKDPAFVEQIKQISCDIIVVVAFGQILSKEILEYPAYGCVNVHASLLPRWRGAAPIQWSILAGDAKTGVTIMQMDVGLDTGDMLAKTEIPLDGTETGESLFEKLSVLGGPLLLETLDKIQEGTVQPEKQKEEDSTYAKMLTRDMGQLDFTKDALSLERTIRGLNSWPSAYTYYAGKMLKIWGAKVVEEEGNAVPGEVVKIQKDGFFIQTGKGLLKAEQVQLEGKKKMSAGDFLRGMQMQPGEKLGKEA
ncbi:MAG: methionyl-tRNA formyltransferase [Clostridiales bacterium]|nr:methionyl-tRNA formyltransferase [Clostridiales bacterium]